MKHLLSILLFSFFFSVIGRAQFADKSVYLIDSLNLEKLDQYDQFLIDSIIDVYQNTTTDSQRVALLAILSEELSDQKVWSKYNQLVFELSEEALKSVSTEKKETRLYFLDYKNRALNNYGYLHLMQGNVEKALEYYGESKKILEKIDDQQGLAAYYNSIGYIHINQGSIKKGLDLLLKSLKIKEKLENKSAIANSLNNIGYVYKNQDEFDKALEYFDRSLKIREDLDDKAGIALCLGHIGSIYDSKGNKNKALELFQKAYQLSKETSNDYMTSFHLFNVGAILYDQQNYNEAISYFTESLDLRNKINDQVGITSSLTYLGKAYFKKGNIEKALNYGNESMSIAKKINYPKEISNAAELLHRIFLQQKNWKSAHEMFQLQINMRDSIKNEETQKATIRQQMQYVYEKEKLADSLEFANAQAIKDLQIKENLAKIQAQKAEKRTLYGGILLLILLVGAVLVAFRNKKRDNETISKQKELVDIKNKEIVDSINYAKRIQSAILPPDKQVKELLPNSFIFYQPKDIVAGDFYWLESVSSFKGGLKEDENNPTNSPKRERIILFAAADCTGHGVPGAMVSVVCNNALNRSVREHGLTDPAKILDKSREIVVQEFQKSDEEVKDGMDIALCSLKWKVESKKLPNTLHSTPNTVATLQYAGAHNPLWILRNGELLETKADKQPIGKYDRQQPYSTHSFNLEEGDTIYIFQMVMLINLVVKTIKSLKHLISKSYCYPFKMNPWKPKRN